MRLTVLKKNFERYRRDCSEQKPNYDRLVRKVELPPGWKKVRREHETVRKVGGVRGGGSSGLTAWQLNQGLARGSPCDSI